MFRESKQDWLEAFENPDALARIQARMVLLASKSEHGYRQVYEPRIVGVATDQANDQVLISPNPSESANAAAVTHRQLKIPSSYGAILEELNYRYGDGSGDSLAAPTSDMSATTLALKIDGEIPARFPKFTLGRWHRGNNGVNFGVLPLGIIVPPQLKRGVELIWNAEGGAGSDDLDVEPSLTVRFEPLWLLQAAGLYLPSDPR